MDDFNQNSQDVAASLSPRVSLVEATKTNPSNVLSKRSRTARQKLKGLITLEERLQGSLMTWILLIPSLLHRKIFYIMVAQCSGSRLDKMSLICLKWVFHSLSLWVEQLNCENTL